MVILFIIKILTKLRTVTVIIKTALFFWILMYSSIFLFIFKNEYTSIVYVFLLCIGYNRSIFHK